MELVKRNLRPSLFLLLLNGAALACAAFAVGEGVFADNPIAAAFPALLAFLLTFWQPWLFFLCLIPGGPYVAAFFAVPATLVIYRTGPGRRIVRGLRGVALGLGPTRLMTSVGGFLLIGALVTLSGYKDYPVRHHGLPPSYMLPVKIESGGNGKSAPPYTLTDSRYYSLSHFIDDEFLWRVRVPCEQVATLAKALSMQRIRVETLPDTFWKQPPYWWKQPGNGELEAYQTPDGNVKRGEGWHTNAVYDPQTHYLYVWGENNF